MRLSWSHSRFIEITCNGLKTQLSIPLYDIQGKLISVQRVGDELIIDFSKKMNQPGLKPPVIKKDATEARDPDSLR